MHMYMQQLHQLRLVYVHQPKTVLAKAAQLKQLPDHGYIYDFFEEIEGMLALTNRHDDTSHTSGLARASVLGAHYLHKAATHTLSY